MNFPYISLFNRPTLRWIFQTFQSIHAVCIQGIQQVSNLTSERVELIVDLSVMYNCYISGNFCWQLRVINGLIIDILWVKKI